MVLKLLSKLFKDPGEVEIKKAWPIVEKINQIEQNYQETLKEEQIPEKTAEFKQRIKNGESLDKILPEAFALTKFAARKLQGTKHKLNHLYSENHDSEDKSYTWDMIHYDVQLLGGIILHRGKIAEMKTGEGKTLVCTLPLYLNALTEKGVFLVTANEYLAQRDAEWMSILFNKLGLTVGVTLHNQNQTEKKKNYQCDITYGTNNEFGFDYLRDNMATDPQQIVQRNLYYAIIDEVDSILIDEARTPLIISAQAEESTDKYKKYSNLVKHLQKDTHFIIDEKQRTATLTEEGILKMEQLLSVENIYTDAGFEEVHHLEQSLKAHAIFKRDVDYVVKNGEVIIVDEFTGRLMEGRRYSDGLHQAIEAKENVEIKRESKTLATITFQNYFRLFEKLAGMTGTAKTEAEEFQQIYNLETVQIPTHRPILRQDKPDMIFKNEKGKFLAIADRVQKAHTIGQPVLIGTISIEKSERLSNILKSKKIPHNVLNAKFHEQEAEIIAKAGQKGAVTIATNMAGRGTDIKLDQEAKNLGGLLVIGTERHESRRIDNQLRGRSGRQGDPGESQFYVSMEDDLMRIFGSERVQMMMEAMKIPDDMPVQNKFISNTVEGAQKKVEGRNFDIRKHLVEYDDVMNKHREIIYKKRNNILHSQNIKNDILILIEKKSEQLIKNAYNSEEKYYDFEYLFKEIEALSKTAFQQIDRKHFENLTEEEDLIESLKNNLIQTYLLTENQLIDKTALRHLEKNIYLSIIDTLWMEHIDKIQDLRESVSLRSYGQRDPLIEYKEQAYTMFIELNQSIQSNTVSTLFKINIIHPQINEQLLTQEKTQPTNEKEINSTTQARFTEFKNSSKNTWVTNSNSTPTKSNYSHEIEIIKIPSSNNQPTKLGRNDRCLTCNNKIKKCACQT